MNLDDRVAQALNNQPTVGADAPASAPSDSIRAPKETKHARIESRATWEPLPLSQLGEGIEVDWLWFGYVAAGHVTLLTGLWKAGKSTLIGHLIHQCARGGQLGTTVAPCTVIIVSEEGPALWARRRDDLGIGDHVLVACRPFVGKPSHRDWQRFLEVIADRCQETEGRVLVVVDTLASFTPGRDENDAAGVMAALMPLHTLTSVGAAVLIVHHPRKGDAGEAQASRGSGALPGFVDFIMELRRHNAKDRADRRRKVTAYSRFDETPQDVVLELRDDGYVLVGEIADARREDRQNVISGILEGSQGGLTATQVRDVWPQGKVARPAARTISLDLDDGAGRLWTRTGAGKRGDPYVYSKLPDSIRACPNS